MDPQYKHTCSCGACKFLGTHKHCDIEYDMYYCLTEGKYPAVYVRWSDEADDVVGAPVAAINTAVPAYVAIDRRNPLWQAKRQARIQKFIP